MAFVEDDTAGEAQAGVSPFLRVLLMGLAAITAIFALGVVVGITVAAFEKGDISASAAAFAVGAMLAMLASAWLLRRLIIARRSEPVSASVRKSNRLMWLSLIIGVGLGIFLSLGSDLTGAPLDLFANTPVSPAIAAIAIAVWLLVAPVSTVRWFQTIDEHALEAYQFGSLVSLHLFLFAAPVWWFGWRGGFFPEPDMMLLYVAVMVAWCLAWTWRRYR